MITEILRPVLASSPNETFIIVFNGALSLLPRSIADGLIFAVFLLLFEIFIASVLVGMLYRYFALIPLDSLEAWVWRHFPHW